MAEVKIPSLAWLMRVTEMMRWWERQPRGQQPLQQNGGKVWNVPFGFAKLTSPLVAGGSATAVVRVRNDGDTDWEDTTLEMTLYAGGHFSASTSFATDTLVDFDFCLDPKHPHYVVRGASCPE
jgi:hypothetical protein